MLLDINNFGPFHSNVWGTFSDWIMILVTFGTALLLWRTLRLQLDTLREQQSITKIEHARFKKSIEPFYELAIADTQITSHPELFVLSCSFIFNNTLAVANTVKIAPTNETMQRGNWIFVNANGTEMEFPIAANNLTTAIVFGELESIFPKATCSFFVEFNDQLNQRYSQLIIVVFEGADYKITHNIPFPIDP